MENKSKQVERIATKIQETFQMWETIGGTPETKQEYEIKQFPKMYHSIDDSISIPLFVDGKKIVVMNKCE
jgi:TATA-box binding protein (TBP) (component of TFIID and TFIIIB)